MSLGSCMAPHSKMTLRQILPGGRLDKYTIVIIQFIRIYIHDHISEFSHAVRRPVSSMSPLSFFLFWLVANCHI